WYQRRQWAVRRERELRRLASLPRYQHTSTDLLGRPFEINDATSFLPAYRAIHQRGIYAFAAPQLTSPRILDCGAHLGLATIYWKTLFPSAEITAFEPDPEAFGMLQRNCKIFKLENVDLINAAVWTKDGRSDFLAEGRD